MRHRRSGFTLVEMLVVIAIILILAGLVVAVFNTGRSSDRLRSAARIGQSAFLGAKDRALHAKDLRGVRLTRDLTDNTLVNGFVYLQPLPQLVYPANSVQLERIDMNGDGNADSSGDVVIVRGFDASSVGPPRQNVPPTGARAVDWFTKKFVLPTAGRMQIGTQWFTYYQDQNSPYVLAQGNEVLRLQTPYGGTAPIAFGTAGDAIAYPASTTPVVTIQLGNDILPFHQPIPLSSNVVIDLKFSGGSVQTMVTQAGGGAIDIMFSPRGAVSGYLSGLGPMHFLLRDLKDAVGTSQYTVKDSNGNPVACGGLIVGA